MAACDHNYEAKAHLLTATHISKYQKCCGFPGAMRISSA